MFSHWAGPPRSGDPVLSRMLQTANVEGWCDEMVKTTLLAPFLLLASCDPVGSAETSGINTPTALALPTVDGTVDATATHVAMDAAVKRATETAAAAPMETARSTNSDRFHGDPFALRVPPAGGRRVDRPLSASPKPIKKLKPLRIASQISADRIQRILRQRRLFSLRNRSPKPWPQPRSGTGCKVLVQLHLR